MTAGFQSLTLITPDGAQELAISGGEQPGARPAALKTRALQAYSHLQLSPIQRLHGAIGWALRWSLRGLCLCPLLVLLKALQLTTGDRRDLLTSVDLITVLCVGLVVLCVGLLACWLLLSIAVGLRSSRVSQLSPRPVSSQLREAMARLSYRTPLGPTPLAQLSALSQQKRSFFRKRLYLQGTVVPCDGRSAGPLLRDAWLQRDDHAARWLTARTFAVVCEGCPTAVIRCASAPVVLGPRLASPGEALDPQLASWLAGRSAPFTAVDLASQPAITLSAGVRVELVASGGEVVENLDQLLLDGRPLQLPAALAPGSQGPYRQAQLRRGLLLTSRPATPIILRLC